MSWGVSVNGHQENQDPKAIEKFARAVGRLAKEADIGVTYLNVSHQGGSKALIAASQGIDDTAEPDGEEADD